MVGIPQDNPKRLGFQGPVRSPDWLRPCKTHYIPADNEMAVCRFVLPILRARARPPLCCIVAQRKLPMSENSVVRARIDERIKTEAAAVLEAMGLTVSDAFRLMMVRIAKEKALPFEPLVPNEETIEAMKAARRGEVTTAGSPGELLASLNADC